MPGMTTEVLNDDIKELKAEIKEFKAEFHHSLEMFQRDFVKIAVELAELRAELKASLAIARWGGALLVTSILTSGAAGLWWASGLNAKVENLGARMDERSRATDARLDRLETAITRFIEQGRPAPPAAKAEAAVLKN